MASIETIAETGSTNADLLARLRAGEPLEELHWLVAEKQTNGRGRLGREWSSPSGNLHASTALTLRDSDPPAANLSFVAALAVFDTLERSLFAGTPILLKWPNDALVNNDKIAGILLERHESTVVVGFGVNVCYAPELPDRATTSIIYENGKHGGNPMLVHSILHDCLTYRLDQWRRQGAGSTLLAWAVRSHRYGDPLIVTNPDGSRTEGEYRGIDSDGALLLYEIGKGVHAIHAGDVTLG